MAGTDIAVKKYVVRLSAEEREQLQALIRKGKSPAKRLLKSRILLKADVSESGEGWSDSQIIAAALACGASILYSEDLHHGQMVDGKLSIRSPYRLRAEQRAKPYRTTKRRAVARA